MKKTILAGVMVLMLAACSSSSSHNISTVSPTTYNQARMIEKKVRESADYWQRTEAVSAASLTGPKAQYQLHTDIASCVSEVRELVRLGSIREAQPPKDIAMDKGLKGGWVSATRNGPLYAENQPFQDFDGCMASKGWERADFVTPVAAQNAARNYSGTILGVSPYAQRQVKNTSAPQSGYNN